MNTPRHDFNLFQNYLNYTPLSFEYNYRRLPIQLAFEINQYNAMLMYNNFENPNNFLQFIKPRNSLFNSYLSEESENFEYELLNDV